MLWFAVHCHRLALDVFLRGRDEAAATEPPAPVAVLERLALLQVDEAASALGLRPGMKRATALALAPGLIALERNEAAEAAALAQLAGWALQFSPSVSLQPPDGLLLEVAPSLRLFGGRQRLLAHLREGLARLGFRVATGVAPTATAAWLLARWRDGSCIDDASQVATLLAELPVARMPAAARHHEALAALGVTRFADLARLPRPGLARRYGPALLEELDRALGSLPEPRRWFEAPPHFHVRLELLAQVEQAEALLFACHRLLLQLCGWLSARQAATRQATFTAQHDGGRHAHEATSIELALSEPSRDPDRLLAVLRERLARTRLPAPAHSLSLDCASVVAHAGTHGQLFPAPASGSENLGRLLERLQARLGRDKVQRLALAEDHRPEAACRIEALELPEPAPGRQPTSAKRGRGRSARGPSTGGAGGAGDAGTPPPSGEVDPAAPAACAPDPPLPGMPRPLWLLERPVPLDERDNRPWWHGPLVLLAGPERIESGWWDGHLVQRDYFIAESETTGWLWIYRVRSGGWFLQGRFG
jgi:protein ImuB